MSEMPGAVPVATDGAGRLIIATAHTPQAIASMWERIYSAIAFAG